MTKSSVLASLVAAGLGIGLFFEHRAAGKLRAENVALRQQMEDSGRLAEENQRLTKRLAEADRAAALSSEQLSELLRLRGEVATLRKKQKPPETARPMVQHRAEPRATPAESPERKIILRDALQFAGYGSPEAALQSTVWAMLNGDAASFLSGLVPEAREAFVQQVEGKTDAEIATLLSEEVQGMRGLRLDRKKSESNDEVVFIIASQESDNGTSVLRDESVMRFKKVDGEWKYAP